MRLHYVPYVPNMWCGPTALASVLGLTYDEADLMLRKLKKRKKRVVHTNRMEHLKLICRELRKRGIKRSAYLIELCVEESRRPHLRETDELNALMRVYAHERWVPVMLFVGAKAGRSNHVVAYDHKTKRLFDTYSRGKFLFNRRHPLRHYYLHCVLVVPEEFYAKRTKRSSALS